MKPATLTATTATAIACISALQPFSPSALSQPQPAPERKLPNIFVFLADDLSWTTTAIGDANPDFPTPNIKRLAATGMTFDRAYVSSPSCAPSRASLLTGLYPIRNGAMFNGQYPEFAQKKWPDYFRALGYEVVAIGKVAHYGQVKRYTFDYSEFSTPRHDVAIDPAIAWLKARQSDPKRSQKPICFMVGTTWPHVPWSDPGILNTKNVHLLPMLIDTPTTRESWSKYAAAVADSDRDLGKTYDAVMKYLGKDTLVVYSADNGMQFPFHKWNVYNGGLHEPFIVSWPGKIAPNTRTQAMISWIDVLPTLMEAVGAKPPATGMAKGQIDGISFLPVLLGQKDTHRDIIYGTHSGDGQMNEYPMRTVIGPRYKYIRNLAPDRTYTTHIDKKPERNPYWPTWVSQAKKDPAAADIVERYHHRPPEELYDLEKDPYDLHNLAADPAYAATLLDYRQKLDAHMQAYNDKGLPTEAYFKKRPATDDEEGGGAAAPKSGKSAKKAKKGPKVPDSMTNDNID